MGKKFIIDHKDFWIDLRELHFLDLVCDLTCALRQQVVRLSMTSCSSDQAGQPAL
jgi:hypothetical protein